MLVPAERPALTAGLMSRARPPIPLLAEALAPRAAPAQQAEGRAAAFADARAQALAEGGEEATARLTLPHTVGYWLRSGSKQLDNWVGVVTPRDLVENVIYSKERKLIDICKAEKAAGTRVWVYVQMTGKRNIQPRLKALLEKEGLKVGVLRSGDVDPKELEDWIARHGRDFDVMISHPKLVSTGLDNFSKAQGGHNYATIVFYETGYSLFDMRQAARRAWRIGQTKDCKVYYPYYCETMQHRAMQLMSHKMAAAQALEGEFSAEGLAAMAGEDNLQMALARSLAERIDEADMQRSWSKVKSGGKKKLTRPTDALRALTDPPVQATAMPPVERLLPLTHAQRQAFKRLAAKPPGSYRPSDFRCIAETAVALVAAGLAERSGDGYRCALGEPALGEVLTWFQRSHGDSPGGAGEPAPVVGAVPAGEPTEGPQQVGDGAPAGGQRRREQEVDEAAVGRQGEGGRQRSEQRDGLGW
jgi:hypothetical protein